MIDLNKKRAARQREANRAPIRVKLGAKTFDFPVELPFDVVVTLVSLTRESSGADSIAAVSAVFKQLLGDEYDAFMAVGPSLDDLTELMDELLVAYGMSSGESAASAAS
jgi:hypothetical protein